MIYANDVYSKTKRGGKMNQADKAKVIMGGLLVANIGFTFLGAEFITALGIPLLFIIFVQLILYFIFCIQIFRFVVFREQDRDLEESDLFMPYYKFRPGSCKTKNHIGTYDMYELKNNSYVSVISFKFGMNNDKKTEQTQIFLNKIQDYIHERNLYCRFITMNENFTEAEEADKLLKNANSIVEPKLRAAQLEICNEVLNFTEKRGSVMCIYVMVYASTSFFKDDLEDAMIQIMTLYEKVKKETSFRKLEAIEQRELLLMFKRFYGMEAIDLSLSQIQYNIVNSDILKSILVYKIISKEGKVYSNSIFDEIQTGVKYIK